MPLYNGPVIDTHHHIWLRKDVAWLADPPIPRMFGDYFGLRRDYPVEEWINDIVPQGVVKSVHVTAMWGRARARRDTLAASGRRQARLSARHRLQCRSGRSRHRRRAEGAEDSFPICAACGRCCIGTAIRCAGRRNAAGLLQRPRFPPRLRAAGKTRSAFRIAGLCRAGGIRGRTGQGVSQCAHDPGACRHADRAHAGGDRAVARARSRPWRRFRTCM